jgi:hypothetical protein
VRNQAAMTPMTASHNGVAQKPRELAYIEDVLRVPEIWNAADRVAADIEALLNRKSILLAGLSNVDEKIAEAERDIQLKLLVEEGYAALSVAAQERRLKAALLEDDALHPVHYSKQRQLRSELEQLDNDLSAARVQHRTHLGRLQAATEVLSFLSSARNARTAAETLLPY